MFPEEFGSQEWEREEEDFVPQRVKEQIAIKAAINVLVVEFLKILCLKYSMAVVWCILKWLGAV